MESFVFYQLFPSPQHHFLFTLFSRIFPLIERNRTCYGTRMANIIQDDPSPYSDVNNMLMILQRNTELGRAIRDSAQTLVDNSAAHITHILDEDFVFVLKLHIDKLREALDAERTATGG